MPSAATLAVARRVSQLRLLWDGSSLGLACTRWKSSAAPQARFMMEELPESRSLEDMEWRRAVPYSEVPGPWPLPLVGNNWRFLPYIGHFRIEQLDKISRSLYDNYGSCVKLAGILGRPDIVFIADPDDIEKVFRNEDQYPHRPSMPSLVYYKTVLRKDFFGKYAGVLSVQGEEWSSFRTKVQQAMLQPRTAKLYIGAIEEAATALVDRARSIKDENQEMPADFMNELNKWSLESIASIALDTRLGCLDDKCPEDTQQLINAVTKFFTNVRTLEVKFPFWKLFSTPTWRSYINALDTIWRVSLHHIEAAIQRHKDNPNSNSQREVSVLQRLLAANTNDPHVAVVMALEMFIVGIDTVSTAVASTMYQLSQHRDVQEKLHQEISRVLPTRETPITAAHLESMHYLKSCIKENFRMFPTVLWNGRHLSKDTVIHGYQIPKGTMIIFQNYVASNLDKHFADSSKFFPERWMKSAPNDPLAHPTPSASEGAETKQSRESGCPHHHAFSSLPFGYGKRMCLGKRFADLEMQTVICKMIQNFRVEYHHQKLDYVMSPMYMPNGPLKFKLIERE